MDDETSPASSPTATDDEISPASSPTSMDDKASADFRMWGMVNESFAGSVMEEMNEETRALLEKLNCQPNIVHTEIPYIPIPIADIKAYTKLADYASDRIKKIETIGTFEPVDSNVAFLTSTTDDPKCSLQLAIGHLKRDYIISGNEEEGACGGFRHEGDTVRVFGTLESTNEVVVLVVDEILPVQNFVKCEKILALVAKFARSKYSMYNYEIEKNGQLREYLRRIAENPEQSNSDGE